MAINLVLGVPGGGKSYYTVYKYVLSALAEGRKIVTNLPLNVPYLTEILEYPKDLIEIRMGKTGSPYDAFQTADDMKDDWRNEKNQAPLVIIDEAHFCLPKDKKKKEVSEIREFFSTHRQDGYDIVLITQTDKALPRDILDLIEYRYRLQKKQMFSIFGLFKNRYTLTIYDQQKNVVGSKVESYKKHVFKCYNSHLLSKGEVIESDASKGVGSIWLKPQMIMAYCFLAFVGYKFTYGGLDLNMSELQNSSHFKQPTQENIKTSEIEMVSYSDEEIISTNTDNNVIDSVVSSSVKTIEKQSSKPVIEYLSQSHPMENKVFQIRSWIGNTGFLALYDKDTKEMISRIKTSDLEKMGYTVEKYSECSMKLSFEDISFFVDCSNFKVEKKSGTENFVSKFSES